MEGYMSTATVHAENLHEHFGQTDEAHCHTGEASVRWLRSATNDGILETGSREYQREKVASVWWKQNIMRTILSNTYARIPQIHIRVTNCGDGVFKFELIDGQQRTTAILDFLRGEYVLPDDLMAVDNIDVGGMSVSEVMAKYPEIYNRILNYRITTLWYENLDDDQVSKLFVEVLNNTNDMNSQEMRNAIRGLFSSYVRDRSRFEDQHQLFTRVITGTGKKSKTTLKYIPKITLKGRMEVDEWVSQLIYLYEHGLAKGIKNQKLTDWVRDIQAPGGFAAIGSAKFRPYRRKYDVLLDFAYRIITSVSTTNQHRLSPMVAMVLVSYANELQKGQGLTVEDSKKFTDRFFEIIDKWSDNKKKLYMNETTKTGKQMPPMIELFGGKNENAIATIVTILDKELAADKKSFGLMELDSRESFTRADITKKWKEQGRKCFYTGRVLNEDELVGDHYVPRSWGVDRGGVTEYTNLVVTDAQTNLKKLSMHGDDFIKKLNG
jgi:hypothetical protein